MTKLGSRKLYICPEVTKMGSIIGHRIGYNGVGALRGQRHIPSKNLPKYPRPPPPGKLHGIIARKVDSEATDKVKASSDTVLGLLYSNFWQTVITQMS